MGCECALVSHVYPCDRAHARPPGTFAGHIRVEHSRDNAAGPLGGRVTVRQDGNVSTSAGSDEINRMGSRQASDSLLLILSSGRWRPTAWVNFVALATRRSIATAKAHPRAFAETTVIHVLMGLLSTRRGLPWIVSTWFMAVTHLGMLDARSSIGIPNALTLARANLPAIGNRVGRWIPLIALGSDFADGKIARATGVVTPFGSSADFLADTAVWTWFTLRHENNRLLQTLTFAAWAAPVVGLTAASMYRGKLVELPRSAWFRPAAVMEIVIGVRFVVKQFRR